MFSAIFSSGLKLRPACPEAEEMKIQQQAPTVFLKVYGDVRAPVISKYDVNVILAVGFVGSPHRKQPRRGFSGSAGCLGVLGRLRLRLGKMLSTCSLLSSVRLDGIDPSGPPFGVGVKFYHQSDSHSPG